jgi:hypothetical protein
VEELIIYNSRVGNSSFAKPLYVVPGVICSYVNEAHKTFNITCHMIQIEADKDSFSTQENQQGRMIVLFRITQ